jgi:hypothetical protein
MENYIGVLQEYCHNNRISDPIYKSTSLNNIHGVIWSSTVVVAGSSYRSTKQWSKKQSEHSAASNACSYILPIIPAYPKLKYRRTNLKKSSYKLDNTLIAVDLNSILPDFKYLVEPTIHYFTTTHSNVDTRKYNGVTHVIDCVQLGAIAHFMTLTIARMTMILSHRRIVIASNDPSIGILIYMLRNNGYDVTHIKTGKDLIDLFTVSSTK